MGWNMVTVVVPATTANLGPGFDCLGAALSLYNRFQFSLLPTDEKAVVIEATGLEADSVARDESNLAYRAFAYFYQQIRQTPPPVHLAIALEVPLARGLGSSATAIVGGLLGANALAGSPVSQEKVMEMAIALEGHPDNVVPALIGGCRLSASGSASSKDSGWTICEVPWHSEIVPIVAIPNFELSTAEARQVLPQSYSRADAIFNMAHLGLLLRGLETGRADWLSTALQDRIHQPYRQQLIRGYEAVQRRAIAAGAYGMVISGAGPTLLAIAHINQAADVEQGMAIAWAEQGIDVQTQVLQLDTKGAVVLEISV
jgi:homoserine kinase